MMTRVVHTVISDGGSITVTCNERGGMTLIARRQTETITIELGRTDATELTAALARYWRSEGFEFGGGIGQ